MPNISEILQTATETLRQNQIEEPRRQASLLLFFILQKNQTFLIAHPEYQLTESELSAFQDALDRRSKCEPLQHITGKQEFYGLDFEVNSDVLIPRPETELIVENAIEILVNYPNPMICEVGVGSGCISISILRSVNKAKAIGLDISKKALQIAQRNAETHGVLNRFDLRISHVFEKINEEKFDVIVSNPPYISSSDIPNLQAEVRDFEPVFALTDGGDGYSIIAEIIKTSPKFLKEDGFLLMEIGFGQSEKVGEMFSDKIWKFWEILPDLQGIPRMVKAQIT